MRKVLAVLAVVCLGAGCFSSALMDDYHAEAVAAFRAQKAAERQAATSLKDAPALPAGADLPVLDVAPIKFNVIPVTDGRGAMVAWTIETGYWQAFWDSPGKAILAAAGDVVTVGGLGAGLYYLIDAIGDSEDNSSDTTYTIHDNDGDVTIGDYNEHGGNGGE